VNSLDDDPKYFASTSPASPSFMDATACKKLPSHRTCGMRREKEKKERDEEVR
jgi:hypothetical protein